jgi:hypothetical protein
MMITLYIILQLNMFIIESWGDILPPKFYAAYAWSLLHTVVSSDTYTTTIELFLFKSSTDLHIYLLYYIQADIKKIPLKLKLCREINCINKTESPMVSYY